MSELERQLAGVTPPDPPSEETPSDESGADGLEGSNDPEGASKPDGQPKEDDRPVLNVKREFERKYQRQEQELADLRAKLEALGSASPKSPDKGLSLETMSVAELRQLRDKVPPENKQYLEDLIVDKAADEKATARQQQFATQQSADQKRLNANQTAVNRFPQLLDEQSKFREAVYLELQNRGGDVHVKQSPTAILDAANHVAVSMGLKPHATRAQGRVATGANSAPADKSVVNDVELDEGIMSKLSAALPAGMEFDKDALKERMAYYKKNIGHHTGGTK